MKTQPMSHQIKARALLQANPEYFALAAEQGTGKTWSLIDDIERQYESGAIEAALIVAPKGVHTNWARREIPIHMSAPHAIYVWDGMTSQKSKKAFEKMLSAAGLKIFVVNIDAIAAKRGFLAAATLVKKFKTMMIVDESQTIKNPDAVRTKRATILGAMARSRRIASGTMIANNALDLFSQYNFLKPGLIGTTSYRAFVAEYAHLLPHNSRLVQDVMRKTGARMPPQIVERDELGRVKLKNMEKLAARVAPYTFRVLKKDCLDLPDKIYKIQYFELEKEQMVVYKLVKKQSAIIWRDGVIDILAALALSTKLKQITSGFVLRNGGVTEQLEASPRLDALEQVLEGIEGQVIIWAIFREEISQIVARLGAENCREYHGGVKAADRDRAVDDFQSGKARFFVANPATGGRGLTLTNASIAIYYSSSINMEHRLQSEDRCHRKGTKNPVLYIDLVATETVDEKIALALQGKIDLATAFMEALKAGEME